jgi:hypothetical protein
VISDVDDRLSPGEVAWRARLVADERLPRDQEAPLLVDVQVALLDEVVKEGADSAALA